MSAGCFGKIGYPSRAEAEQVRRCVRERRNDGVTLSAYHCDKCGKFHIGRGRTISNKGKRGGDVVRAKLARWLQLTQAGE
jgi:hypothetical protein